MASTTKKFMYIDLEFMDAEKYGYINLMNSAGDVGATVGMGNVEENSIGFYGTDEMEEFEIAKYNNVVISNYNKDENGEITEYLPVNFIMRGSESKIEYEREINGELIKQGSFALNKDNLNTYEKANGVEWDLEDENGNPKSAMGLEHSSAIAFINPDTNRLIGVIDTVKETFTWDGGFSFGEVAEDSLFEVKISNDEKMNFTLNAEPNINPILGVKRDNTLVWKFEAKDGELFIGDTNDKGFKVIDGGDVEFTGEIIYNGSPIVSYFYKQSELDDGILDSRYYTETEIDDNYFTKDEITSNYYDKNQTIEEIEARASQIPNIMEERGLYQFIDNAWTRVEYEELDERYDIPDDADPETIYYCKLENGFFKGDDSQISPDYEISFLDIPIPEIDDVYFSIYRKSLYKFDGEQWNTFSPSTPEEEIVKVSQHKKDIDLESVVDEEIYYIENTDKFYKVLGGVLEEIDVPDFCFYQNNSFPTIPNEEDFVFIEGGKFYQSDGNSFSEIEKPLEIPVVKNYWKDKYNTTNKIVFVVRGK